MLIYPASKNVYFQFLLGFEQRLSSRTGGREEASTNCNSVIVLKTIAMLFRGGGGGGGKKGRQINDEIIGSRTDVKYDDVQRYPVRGGVRREQWRR